LIAQESHKGFPTWKLLTRTQVPICDACNTVGRNRTRSYDVPRLIRLHRSSLTMPICHEHNLAAPLSKKCPFGIRIRLRSTDPFKNLVGADWTREHWFATREERDEALGEMSGRYLYFRPGDQPSLEYEKVER
jgi:hypothetical protein